MLLRANSEDDFLVRLCVGDDSLPDPELVTAPSLLVSDCFGLGRAFVSSLV